MTGKDIAKITLNLVAIYVVGGLLLAWVYSMTSPVIYKNKQEDKAMALAGMMPVHIVANVPEASADAVRAALPEGGEVSVTTEGGTAKIDALLDIYKKDKLKLKGALKKAGATSVSEYTDFTPDKKGDWEVAHKHAEYFEAHDKDGKLAGYIVESYHKGYSGAPGIYVAISPEFVVTKVEVLSHGETPGLGDEIEKKWFKDMFIGKDEEHLEVIKGDTTEKIQAITGATISTRAITYGARDAVRMIKEYASGQAPQAHGHEAGEAKEGESGNQE